MSSQNHHFSFMNLLGHQTVDCVTWILLVRKCWKCVQTFVAYREDHFISEDQLCKGLFKMLLQQSYVLSFSAPCIRTPQSCGNRRRRCSTSSVFSSGISNVTCLLTHFSLPRMFFFSFLVPNSLNPTRQHYTRPQARHCMLTRWQTFSCSAGVSKHGLHLWYTGTGMYLLTTVNPQFTDTPWQVCLCSCSDSCHSVSPVANHCFKGGI